MAFGMLAVQLGEDIYDTRFDDLRAHVTRNEVAPCTTVDSFLDGARTYKAAHHTQAEANVDSYRIWVTIFGQHIYEATFRIQPLGLAPMCKVGVTDLVDLTTDPMQWFDIPWRPDIPGAFWSPHLNNVER